MANDFRDIRRELRTIEARLSAVEQRHTRLATAVGKIDARTRRVVTPLTDLPVGVTPIPVTWSTPYPDTGYGVVNAITCGQAVLPTLHAGLQSGTRTPEGCVILVSNTGAAPVALAALDTYAFRSA